MIVLFPSIPLPVDAGAGSTFTNLGPDVVYYGSHQSVSSAVNDGSIALAGTVTLVGTVYLVVAPTATRAYVNVNNTDTGLEIAVQDEGVDLAVRSKINFTGTNVVATDDAINNRISVAISGTPGPAGAAGPAGAGALGTDVWTSQGSPGSVTDWGTIINTLISGGARRLLFSAHDFPFSTQIDLHQKYSIVLEGESGALHPTIGTGSDHAAARLIWKGAASSGIAVKMDGSDGITFRDIGIVYDNAAYNGDLISLDFAGTQTGNANFQRCQLGASDAGSAILSARSILKMTNAVTCLVERCSLAGAQTAIRGFETVDSFGQAAAQQHPDNNIIKGNTFQFCSASYFTNIGNHWTIEDNELLYGAFGGTAVAATIACDVACNSTFVWEKNRHWDFANGSQHAISQPSNNNWTATIRKNFFDTHTGVTVQLLGHGSITIEDNNFSRGASIGGVALIDLGSGAGATKNYVRIKGNTWTASGTPANVIANLTGHAALDIGPNSEDMTGGFAAHAPELRVLGGHDRIHWAAGNAAAISLAAGQPAITLDGKFQDGVGYIVVQTPGGAASVAGKLLTITFSAALEKGFGQGTPDATHQVPLVFLTPYGISNDSVNIGATIACAAAAQVTGAQQTSFDIYTTNAIPAGAKVGWAYRVVQM